MSVTSVMSVMSFLRGSMYLLPCLCITSHPTTVEIIWVHSRARRLGLGRRFIQGLRIQEASNPLPGSEGFWTACGIPSSRGEQVGGA